MNLKPFDIEAAKAGKPVIFRNGVKPKIIHIGKVYITLLYGDDEQLVRNHLDGCYKLIGKSEYDLFMAPEIKVGWVNVAIFPSCEFGYFAEGLIHRNKEDALTARSQTCLYHGEPVRIEFEV